MMNNDDIRRCTECDEPTKKAAGLWDGIDPGTGEPVHGCIYSCSNAECAIRSDVLKTLEETKAQRERVQAANWNNGTDPELLRNARTRVCFSMQTAADVIGVTAAEYSAKENGRSPISKDEYVILMSLFHTIEETTKGKRCGKCRFYREHNAFSTFGRCALSGTDEQVGINKSACGRWKEKTNERHDS